MGLGFGFAFWVFGFGFKFVSSGLEHQISKLVKKTFNPEP